MRKRAPLAKAIGVATLANHSFRITADGYASVTPRRGDKVYGILWRLTPRDRVTLDVWEGMWHVFQAEPDVPEAAQARRKSAAFLRHWLDRSGEP